MVIDATPTAGTPTLPQSVFGRVMPVTRTLDAHFNIIHEHQTLDIRYMHEALGDAFQRDVRQQLPGKHSHKLYVIPDTRVVGAMRRTHREQKHSLYEYSTFTFNIITLLSKIISNLLFAQMCILSL